MLADAEAADRLLQNHRDLPVRFGLWRDRKTVTQTRGECFGGRVRASQECQKFIGAVGWVVALKILNHRDGGRVPAAVHLPPRRLAGGKRDARRHGEWRAGSQWTRRRAARK